MSCSAICTLLHLYFTVERDYVDYYLVRIRYGCLGKYDLDMYLTKLGNYRFYIWDIYCELAMGFLEKYDLDLYVTKLGN